MLARYQMKRGATVAELPRGRRFDTRMHTQHPLRPPTEIVEPYLAQPTAARWKTFRTAYRAAIAARIARDITPFAALAALAASEDVYLGCSCPTTKNPDVRRCHTWLALEIMHERYPQLAVVFPTPPPGSPTPSTRAASTRRPRALGRAAPRRR